MAKKRVIHCGKCESPVTVYKKGKKHRVFICPSCGIIATNPAPIGLALKAARLIPGPMKRALEESDKLLNRGEGADTTTPSQCTTAPTRRNLTPFYISKALGGA